MFTYSETVIYFLHVLGCHTVTCKILFIKIPSGVLKYCKIKNNYSNLNRNFALGKLYSGLKQFPGMWIQQTSGFGFSILVV